ncbi:SNF2 helicase associated domain-containing protein [Niallia oryzisoli]|uniref:SNF2 helicase associated domain-containing protein n=1 Tax=Niallia oryzisoli TaxID=1737571 RepID=A0ABZ2CLY8_9BACI
MNIPLNQKIIKEMCGMASFKRGDLYVRNNKVTINEYSSEFCKAVVSGTEDFYVTIERNGSSSIKASCSCPKLASFQKDCQHIAAVLIVLNNHQREGTTQQTKYGSQTDRENNELTDGLLALFNQKQVPSIRKKRHFEDREILDVEFICKPVSFGNEHWMFAIQVKVGQTKVQNIREFLKHVRAGNICMLSYFATYDPSLHCFLIEDEAVFRQLFHILDDEKAYLNTLQTNREEDDKDLLMISPASWETLLPVLEKAPNVKLESNGNRLNQLAVSEEPLTLKFNFVEAPGKGFQLKIDGLHNLIILTSYKYVLSAGKLIRLPEEDFRRLVELTDMLASTGTNQIPVPSKQVSLFLEKVIPGLKRLGEVKLPNRITESLKKTQLKAKLYLDRVNNRLLAGLEFHYEQIIINPLENRPLKTFVMRDIEKEERILQIMEDSSFARNDSGYLLYNEELEYEFLYHVLPKLQKLVQIYATTAVRNRVYRGNPRPKIRVKAYKDRMNWLEFKFDLDGIPEKQIKDVLAALEEKRKYYRLRDGSLLSLETREFDALKRFLYALPDDIDSVEEGYHVSTIQGLRMLETVDNQEVFTIEESFRKFLEDIEHPENLSFKVPENLDHIMREYQKHGYKWMKMLSHYGFGGILADSMGLGKTLQSIAFIYSELTEIRQKKTPVLIVCPSSLTYNWLNELLKFTPDVQAVIIDGSIKERTLIMKEAMDQDVIITSYPLLRKDQKWYEGQQFHTVFFDEAQAFKNPTTQTARVVKKIQAGNRFALTGTPIENSLEELWSIFHVVFPELFQGLKEYSNLTREKIARRIRPFLLRRLKEDVLKELPEKTESIEAVELLPEQKRLYAAYLAKLKHDTLKHLDRETIRKNRIKILAGLTRLRQICCHPALFVDGYKGKSAKFERLLQLLEEARQAGRRVLIFSQFTKMLGIIGRELAEEGIPFFYLDGQTPAEERVELCNRFNVGERDLFLISLKAGGTGLNLTGADTVILYDLWWNPAVEAQAADRAHRIGQEQAVQVIKLVARGSIEEKMNALQSKKKDLIETIIDPGENRASSLTDEDIRELLMM